MYAYGHAERRCVTHLFESLCYAAKQQQQPKQQQKHQHKQLYDNSIKLTLAQAPPRQ